MHQRLEIPQLENWDGKEKCEHLLVVSEQGGDNLWYYRYVIELSEKFPNMKITYFGRAVVTFI